MTRIQRGFRRQGAEAIIIDARGSDLTVYQARQSITRVTGTFPNRRLPGRVEIWIDTGIITNEY